MNISINGEQHDWDTVDRKEALRYRMLQRELQAFDQSVAQDRQIILDQLSACTQRTRDNFGGTT